MRNKEDSGSSFDLFLDTICNTFGGIVFLAILLAIMIQSRSIIETNDPSERAPSSDELRDLTTKLDSLSAESSNLHAALQALPETEPTGDDQEYLDLRNELSEYEETLRQVSSTRSDVAKQLANLLDRNAKQKEENRDVQTSHSAAMKRYKAAERRNSALFESKMMTLQLPKVQSSRAGSELALVDRSYGYFSGPITLFSGVSSTGQIRFTQQDSGSWGVEPIVGEGWELARLQENPEFQKLLGDIASSRKILTIAIWPNSYADFHILRGLLIEKGVSYQLWLMEKDQPLTLSRGSGTQMVQ